jgi:hypothetical protein
LSVSTIIRPPREAIRVVPSDAGPHPVDSLSASAAEVEPAHLAAVLQHLMPDADVASLEASQRDLADRLLAMLQGREGTIARLRAAGWSAHSLAVGLGLPYAVVNEIHTQALEGLRSRILADKELLHSLCEGVDSRARSRTAPPANPGGQKSRAGRRSA